MNEKDLTDKLRDRYVNDVLGGKKKKTFEESFQEALDNTTPEHAGAPDHDQYEFEGEEESEWL
jgi:hypothetical protein